MLFNDVDNFEHSNPKVHNENNENFNINYIENKINLSNIEYNTQSDNITEN